MTSTSTGDTIRVRLARVASDVIGPLPVVVALCAAGVTNGASWPSGVGWGLLAMFFVGILPYSVTWKVRHPADDEKPSQRSRVAYMGTAVVTAAVGLAVLRLSGAPADVVRLTTAILVALVVTAVCNSRWRWSNHMAAATSGAALLVVRLGAIGLLAIVAIPLVAWARLVLQRHDVGELFGGLVLGATVAPLVLLAL